eukprot:10195113-Lingulodinium_polyedra.AAC.1
MLSKSPDNAAGLDGSAPRHWKCLCRKAAAWLIVLFAQVEGGTPWPDPLRAGKTVFISKPSTNWEGPLTFRILMILPYAY